MATILAADGQWRDALLHHDKEAIERLVGREFTLTTAVGVISRAAWLENSLLWQTKEVGWRDEPHTDLYANAGVRRGVLHWHVIKDKLDPRTRTAEIDIDFLVTDVWVRRAGQWQVVARHSTIPLAH